MSQDSNGNGIREGEPPYRIGSAKPGGIEPSSGLRLLQLSFVLFAAGTVWFGSVIAFGGQGGGPTVRSPNPFPYFLLIWSNVPPALIAVLPAVLFLGWQPGLWFRQSATSAMPFPVHSWILFAAATFFSLICFVGGWEFGVQYQDISYTRSCAVLSAGLALSFAILAVLAAQTKSFYLNVLAHAVLFYWLSSYAFPYLGETI